MALTEEHERTARQVAKEINPDRSGDYEVIVIERFLAALPKPVAWRGMSCAHDDDRSYGTQEIVGWEPLFAEAPITQPASAPSEQKPDGQWVRCTPELIHAGVYEECANKADERKAQSRNSLVRSGLTVLADDIRALAEKVRHGN